MATSRWISAALCLALLRASAPAQPSPGPALDGYSPQSSAVERDWEGKFRAIPSPDRLRASMQFLTAHPHAVGSPYDREIALWLQDRFREWGFETSIETFYVLFPTPKERSLELTAPVKYVAKLAESPVAGDPTSNQQSEQLPTYNAYSADGDVTGRLVYVNYGRREDFDRLERLGVSVKGAIVIVRYGAIWRGIKPKVAAERGAIGCILYSDPQQDGYGDAEVFPDGPGRPADGVQRGGVNDTYFPGDPLTPGIPATKDAKRLSIKDSPIITKIPVLPISYGDAQPLLAALGGQVVPPAWRGGLPITYRTGPGPAMVHLKMISNWDIKPIYDVIAKIPGSAEPDQWVLRGNHYDAWVNGAEDPAAGLAAELEEARALGQLMKLGWRPRRTIVYCAWDGEEPGLLGSTEWVEMHAQELNDHAVLYVNSDTNDRGFLDVGGSHTLERFLNGVAREIPDPESSVSVLERARLAAIAGATRPEMRAELRTRPDLRIAALGDGSDYSPFLDYLAVPSLDLGFDGEGAGSAYHSIYDDFYWYTHFSDSKFVYGRALSQVAGAAVMRMADAELLPYDFTDLADTVSVYLQELKEQLARARRRIIERNRELDEGVFAAISDPEKPTLPPKREAVPPFLNFAPIQNGAEALTESARRYRDALSAAEAGGLSLDPAALHSVNLLLMKVERTNLRAEGLPGRPWYKNQIYAPGAYTGYGVKTMPGVREAMDRHDWTTAGAQTPVVGSVLEEESRAIDAATGQLQAAVRGK